jgi:hypothetical protein
MKQTIGVLALVLLVPAAWAEVHVSFEGMIVHVVGGGVTRAVVPRFDGHQMTITLPASAKRDVERIFQVECSAVCDVPIDGLAFRIADASGKPLKRAFERTDGFRDNVTSLSAVPSPDKPFEKKEDLHADIFASVPVANSVVAGYFELAGGIGTAEPFRCAARFEGAATDTAFPAKVNVDFPNGATLQVLRAGSREWQNIALDGPRVEIAVRNDIPDPDPSHFDMYALLSVKRKNGRLIDLPHVTMNGSPCIVAAFGIPGCTNSSWP